MVTSVNPNESPALYVVHPLDDVPEQKCSAEGLGVIHMSRSVKASLVTLRLYLILILALTLYRLAGLIGLFTLFGHHAAK